jgi:hypothetical protein
MKSIFLMLGIRLGITAGAILILAVLYLITANIKLP